MPVLTRYTVINCGTITIITIHVTAQTRCRCCVWEIPWWTCSSAWCRRGCWRLSVVAISTDQTIVVSGCGTFASLICTIDTLKSCRYVPIVVNPSFADPINRGRKRNNTSSTIRVRRAITFRTCSSITLLSFIRAVSKVTTGTICSTWCRSRYRRLTIASTSTVYTGIFVLWLWAAIAFRCALNSFKWTRCNHIEAEATYSCARADHSSICLTGYSFVGVWAWAWSTFRKAANTLSITWILELIITTATSAGLWRGNRGLHEIIGVSCSTVVVWSEKTCLTLSGTFCACQRTNDCGIASRLTMTFLVNQDSETIAATFTVIVVRTESCLSILVAVLAGSWSVFTILTNWAIISTLSWCAHRLLLVVPCWAIVSIVVVIRGSSGITFICTFDAYKWRGLNLEVSGISNAFARLCVWYSVSCCSRQSICSEPTIATCTFAITYLSPIVKIVTEVPEGTSGTARRRSVRWRLFVVIRRTCGTTIVVVFGIAFNSLCSANYTLQWTSLNHESMIITHTRPRDHFGVRRYTC